MSLNAAALTTAIAGHMTGFVLTSWMNTFLSVLTTETVTWATNITHVSSGPLIGIITHSHLWTIADGTALYDAIIPALNATAFSTTNTGRDSTTWLDSFISAFTTELGLWILSSPETDVAIEGNGHIFNASSAASFKAALVTAINSAGFSTSNTGLDTTNWLDTFLDAIANGFYDHFNGQLTAISGSRLNPHTFA